MEGVRYLVESVSTLNLKKGLLYLGSNKLTDLEVIRMK